MKKNNKWSADNVTKIGTPKIDVITKISKWEKYEYIEMNDTKFIKGSSTKQGSELFEFQTINNIDILIDLLILKNQLQVQYTNNEKIISENITKNDIENIIKFCKRYGFPQWGFPPIHNCCINGCINKQDIGKKNEDRKLIAILESKGYTVTKGVSRSTMLRDISPFSSENYLHIPSFIRALHLLKTDFLRIVTTHNLKEDANIKPLLTESDYKTLDIFYTKKSFQDLYMPYLNPFTTYWNDEKNGLFLNCENLIHLSVYYLCVIQQTGRCFGGYIKICKLCGKFFVTANANRKYCGTPDTWGCTKNAFYQKEKRRRDKIQKIKDTSAILNDSFNSI